MVSKCCHVGIGGMAAFEDGLVMERKKGSGVQRNSSILLAILDKKKYSHRGNLGGCVVNPERIGEGLSDVEQPIAHGQIQGYNSMVNLGLYMLSAW